MSIATFLRDLLPTFGKKDVVSKIRTISKKLNDIVRPALELVVESIGERTYKSAYGKEFMKNVLPYLPGRLRNDPLGYSKVSMIAITNATKLLELLEQYVGKNVGDQIHVEGLTYQKASVIRLIEIIDFFTDYTSRHLSYLVASETNLEAFGRPDGNPYTPAALRYLTQNRGSYVRVLDLLNGDPKKILADIENIPEVTMSEAAIGEVPALAGGAAADPLHLNAIPIVSDIFHWVGIRKVDWEVDRYECAKKEKQDVEMRLECLRNKRSGLQDAQAEAIIDGYTRELTLLRASITEMEAKVK